MHDSLWHPLRLGTIDLPHRLAMAPMTRGRAAPDGTPGPWTAEYYAQRASMGLIITEGVQPSVEGQGYVSTPGIHRPAHVAAWREVFSAVHGAGGRVFMQLMHAGRLAHPANRVEVAATVAPSAVAPEEAIHTPLGKQLVPVPRALERPGLRATIRDFRLAARRAVEAGADGVELHGAGGYLIQQFLAPNANLRTDAYGGSIVNRCRFAIEVVEAVADEIGASRTAIRLHPGSTVGGVDEGSDAQALYGVLLGALAPLELAYVHIVHDGDGRFLPDLRRAWPGRLMALRKGRSLDALDQDIREDLADMVAVGRWALANPDLARRVRCGATLNAPDATTFYSGGEKGYIDYPSLEAADSLACA